MSQNGLEGLPMTSFLRPPSVAPEYISSCDEHLALPILFCFMRVQMACWETNSNTELTVLSEIDRNIVVRSSQELMYDKT